MDEAGLNPKNTGEPGGKRTGQSMTHLIVDGGPYAAFDATTRDCLLPWLSGMPASRTTTKNPKVKYTCPLCASNALGKPGISIVCGECDVPLRTMGAKDDQSIQLWNPLPVDATAPRTTQTQIVT